MTWGRMDDKFHRSRKVRELRKTRAGKEALGAWAFWWSWCLDDKELTGVVPAGELSTDDRKSAVILVKVGLWDEVEDGFYFHDFHQYNPTKKQREAKLEADAQRIAGKRASESEVARDVASDSFATSHPRARAGHGMGSGKSESKREDSNTGTADSPQWQLPESAPAHDPEPDPNESPASLAALARLKAVV